MPRNQLPGRRGETKGGRISAEIKRRKIFVSESDTLKRGRENKRSEK